jgi:hypothetical protein
MRRLVAGQHQICRAQAGIGPVGELEARRRGIAGDRPYDYLGGVLGGSIRPSDADVLPGGNSPHGGETLSIRA